MTSKIRFRFFFFSYFLFALLFELISANQLQNDPSLGHYAFDIASNPNMLPPKVRKPPYIPTNVPCAGSLNPLLLHPKDSLCGDLNKGYVPLNPFNHQIDNQPYPFELIKNKTLAFLAKSLPFLEQDIINIPKVFRMPVHGVVSRTKRATADLSLSKLEPIELEPSEGRSGKASRLRTLGRVLQALDAARSLDLSKESNSSSNSTSTNSTQILTNNHNGQIGDKKAKESSSSDINDTKVNATDSKTKGCDASDGILCQVMQLVAASNSNNAATGFQSSSSSNSGSGALLNTIAQTLQVMNSANSLSGIAQLLTGPADGNKTGESYGSLAKPLLAQVIQAIGTLSSTSSSSGSNSAGNGNGPSFNPVAAILDYFGSSSASHLLPARRKKPLEFEDLFSSLASSVSSSSSLSSSNNPTTSSSNQASSTSEPVQLGQNPPTACPSVEEYVAPVYARNYQGLWKYVVQIPHEGYFTQTVQKTSCVKSKCDYMDGFCKESSRWVSLLVAEVYYPNAKFTNVRQPLGPNAGRLSNPNAKPTLASLNALNNGFGSTSSASHLLHQALVQPSSLQTLTGSNALNSLSPFSSTNVPIKYSFPSVSNSLPADYNAYETLFSRRASVPSVSSGKQAKFVTPLRNKISSLTQSGTSTSAGSSIWSGYSPQQLQHLWQQYQNALGLQSMKPVVRSAHDNYPTSSLLSPLFASSASLAAQSHASAPSAYSQSIGNRWFGASARSSDARPRALQLDRRSSSQPAINEDHSVGSAYIEEDDQTIVTAAPKANDLLRSASSSASSASDNSFAATSGFHQTQSEANSNPTVNAPNSSTQSNNNNNNSSENSEEECDGYDSNGCYVIRVYYDWFLVPGSCKCWKRTTSGGLDTLKRIFIG